MGASRVERCARVRDKAVVDGSTASRRIGSILSSIGRAARPPGQLAAALHGHIYAKKKESETMKVFRKLNSTTGTRSVRKCFLTAVTKSQQVLRLKHASLRLLKSQRVLRLWNGERSAAFCSVHRRR